MVVKRSLKMIGAIVLAAMLLFAAACSNAANNESASGGEQTTATETNAAEATPAEPEAVEATSEPEETIDLGGMKVTYVDPWGRDMETLGQSDYIDRLIARVGEVEEQYNIDFEWIRGPETYWDDMTRAVAAGEAWGDIMFTFPWIAPGWIKAGAAKDLSQLGVDFSNVQAWDPIATAEGKYGNKQFLFGHKPVELNGGITYNKALFDQAGIDDPQTLYEKGQWTFEKFEEAAKLLTDPQNGVYGFATTQSNAIINMLELNNNASLVDFNTMASKFGDPNAITGYDLVHRMMHVDMTWYKDSEDYAALSKLFNEGKIAMFGAEKWVVDVVAAGAAEDFDYRWVVFPKGPSGTGHTMTAGVFLEFIPATMDDEKAKQMLMVYNAIFETSLYPSEEEEYIGYAESMFTDEKSVELYVDTVLNKHYSPTFINKAGITDVFNQFAAELKEGSSTPTALVEKYKPVVEAAVSDGEYSQVVNQ